MSNKKYHIPRAIEDFYKELYSGYKYRCVCLGLHKGLAVYGVRFLEEVEIGFPTLTQIDSTGSITEILGFEALGLLRILKVKD